MKTGLVKAWRNLRVLLAHLDGGAAYARYCAHLAAHHPEAVPPTRDDFHREEMQRRWNGVRRCC